MSNDTPKPKPPAKNGRHSSAQRRPLGQVPHTPGPGHEGEHRIRTIKEFQEDVFEPEMARAERRFEGDEQRIAKLEADLEAARGLVQRLSVHSIGNRIATVNIARLQSEYKLLKARLDNIAATDGDSDDPDIQAANDRRKSRLETKLSEFYSTLSRQFESLEERVDSHETDISGLKTAQGEHTDQLKLHSERLAGHDQAIETVKTGERPSKVPLIAGLIVGFIVFLIKLLIPWPDTIVQGANQTVIVAFTAYNSFWGALVTGVFIGVIVYFIATFFSFGKKGDENTDHTVDHHVHGGRDYDYEYGYAPNRRDSVDDVNGMFGVGSDGHTRDTRRTGEPVHS